MKKQPTIMIVDDQYTNIQLLKAQLKEYKIIEVYDGRAALKRVDEGTPDLIILDIMMPGVDGYSVLSILKSSRSTCRIPIILVTALNDPDQKIKSWEKGADDFIAKPYNPLELRARVKSLLRIRQLQGEIDDVCNMLLSMVTSLEARDESTANHSRRTAYYAEILAREFGAEENQCEDIRTAALLHDIGKIGIKDAVWYKSGKLSESEFELIKTHPVAGEKLCSPITVFKPILPIIRHHHERYDGSGYPDGLQGTNIPFGARVVSIADAFDALTSNRPYRNAFSVAEALGVLQGGAVQQWDLGLVTLFCRLVDEKKIDVRPF